MMELRSPPTPSSQTSGGSQKTALLVLQLLTLAILGVMAFNSQNAAPKIDTTDSRRKVASQLRAAGAVDEAAVLYAQILTNSQNQTNRAQIAYSLAELYLESAQYDKALRWLYEAQLANPQDLQSNIAAKIVHCLERLGRVHAAKAALRGSTQLQTAASVKRSENDPLVAKIGNQKIYYSEIQRALDDLPPELSSRFSKPEGKSMFLKKYVADELLWRKAQKLEYDKNPQIQRQLTTFVKQMVVGKFVEKEVADKIQIDPTDVKNFYEANKERFKKGDKQLTFEEVKDQASIAYRMMKFQTAYGQMIESELSTGDVSVYAENLPQ